MLLVQSFNNYIQELVPVSWLKSAELHCQTPNLSDKCLLQV